MSDDKPFEVPGPGKADIVPDPGDERSAVVDTKIAPYHGVCAIHIVIPGARGTGSGWLLDNRHVVTAAHVVCDEELIEAGTPEQEVVIEPSAVTVVPALDKLAGIGTPHTVNSIVVHPEYVSNATLEFDIAVLRLNEVVELPASPLDYDFIDDPKLVNSDATIAGYPLDRGGGQQMFEHTGQIVGVEPGLIRHRIDTTEGQSGAPLWITSTTGEVTVTGHQVKGFSRKAQNRACRINHQLRDWLAQSTILPA